MHSALASASGAVGGAFGLAALTIELPVSTTIMLRAIAAIARAEGEDLTDPRTGLACLEVFALGGPAPAEAEGGEGGYFAIRALLARGLAQAADLVVDKSAVRGGSALALRFLTPIIARFGAVVSQKLAVQAVAVVGAIGGAGGQPRLHRAFPGCRTRPFHGAPARAHLWRRGGAGRIRPAQIATRRIRISDMC